MRARFPSTCDVCERPICKGTQIKHTDSHGWVHGNCAGTARNLQDPEYARGYHETSQAQLAGPAGSEARENAYAAMEAQWAREGFDG